MLHVEDSQRDVALLARHLKRAGYKLSSQRVDTAEAMQAALDNCEWDVILCDYRMPEFDALAALEVLKRTERDIPFIIISGTVGEVTAVEAMRAGAHDYLMKDNLVRLAATIEREIQEAENRRARRRAEDALKASETELRTLFAAMNDVILVLDVEGRYLKIAPTDPAYLYKPPASLLGKTLHEVFPKEEADFFIEHIRRAIAERRTHRVEYRMQVSDKEVWFDGSVSPIDHNAVIWIARDITARKQMEEALRESEELYKGLVDSAFDGVVIHQNLTIISANRAYAEMFDYEIEELIGLEVLDLTPPEQRDFVRSQINRSEALYETVGLKKDGTRINIEVSGKDCMFEGKNARLAAVRDIGERKQAEEQLRRQLNFTEAITTSMGEGVYALNERGLVTFMNPAAEASLGWTEKELLGRDMHEVIHFQDVDGARRPKSNCPLLGVIASGKLVAIEDDVFTRKDGSVFHVSYTSSPIINQELVVGAVLTFRDITEARQLEEQLRQSQKMEAIGQLAGGVAHDFNNLLTAINGYSSLALQRTNEREPIRGYLEEIKKAGDRAANLTRQLLAFGRKHMLQPVALSLNDVVADLNKMLRRLIGEDVRLTAKFDPALKKIKADAGQIEQVIVNLVVNARDAMPHGGNLTIETGNFEVDGDYASNHVGVRPGSYAMLAVSDTGVGMDDETRARIFEPCLTTTEKGKGTGLGLSTVYGIVKQSGGNIWVYSEPNQGTVFKVYLPQLRDASEPTETATVETPMPRGSETILLVEDEDVVRSLAQEVLEQAGYRVFSVSSGNEALRLFQESAERIDLLLTDVVMSEMSGKELADRLADLRPAMRVLFMSGYTDEAIVHHGIVDSNVQFIQKPFSPESLAKKIREVLD